MTTHQSPAGDRAPVTVIGLGPMGQALAGTFLTCGHPTTVWNRTPAKADALVAHGAVRADTVADAVAASPLVIVCVLDYDAVHAIVDPVADVLQGRTLVNLTADSPQRARETAAWAAEHGIDYLDGSIMSPTVTIGQPEAVFLYSGPEAVYQTHQPTLASLGGTATHVGTDPARAAAYDVALLDFFWTSMSGYVHALALARMENIAATELAPYARKIGELLPGIVDEFAREVDDGHYPGDQSTIISAAAGMAHIIHAAQARDIDAGILSAAKAVAQRAIDAGHGTDGFSRLADILGYRPGGHREGQPDDVRLGATGHLSFTTGLMVDHARQIEDGHYPDDDGTVEIHAAATALRASSRWSTSRRQGDRPVATHTALIRR